MKKSKSNKPPKKKPSAKQKKLARLKNDHRKMVRDVFKLAGFERIDTLADQEFEYENQKSDFDDVFTYENILVLAEYTTTASDKIGAHLKTKKVMYDLIDEDHEEFVEYFCELDETLAAALEEYEYSEIQVRFIYCSRYSFKANYKKTIPNPEYLDYPELRYFKNLTNCIRNSSRRELINFLDVKPDKVGFEGQTDIALNSQSYTASLLPEKNSGFPSGHKVVSFYVDPQALLRRAYVLRRDGWKDSDSLYQRMISKSKIDKMRTYLKDEKRVFVNNIIVTLPHDTEILETKITNDGAIEIPCDPKSITSTTNVHVRIPDRDNSIGVIDGQHRIFAYYEASDDDKEIAKLRKKQNLLATGIIYPKNLSFDKKERFEAKLFLEINSNQTSPAANLKQAIGLVLEPFSAISIATKLITELDESTGPLANLVERYFFDTKKLKTTSIVKYGLAKLVDPAGSDSLFQVWEEPEKDKMLQNKDKDLLDSYIQHCVSQINMMLSAAKDHIGESRWSPDRSTENRFLNSTNVIALFVCMRRLIETKKLKGYKYYKKSLNGFDDFEFQEYHSSWHNQMGKDIYDEYFT